MSIRFVHVFVFLHVCVCVCASLCLYKGQKLPICVNLCLPKRVKKKGININISHYKIFAHPTKNINWVTEDRDFFVFNQSPEGDAQSRVSAASSK